MNNVSISVVWGMGYYCLSRVFLRVCILTDIGILDQHLLFVLKLDWAKLPESVKHIQTISTNTRCNPACRFGSISVISTIGCGVFPSLSCLVSGACGVELNGTGKVSSVCRMRQTVSLNLLHLVSLCPHWRAMAPLQWALIWEITLYPAGSRGNVEEHIKSSLWIRLCALLWGQVMGEKSISRGL